MKYIAKFIQKYPAIIIAVVWIILVLILRFFVVATVGQAGDAGVQAKIDSIFQGVVKWDGAYYLEIAKNGYPLDQLTWPAFYPLFPLLIRAVHYIGLGWVAAGIFVNSLATVVAAQALYVLALEVGKKRRIAILSVIAWLTFPQAHFLSAFYTEALFSALVFSSLAFLMKKKYFYAVVLAALASATRFPAAVLAPVIFLQYLQDLNWNWKKLNWQVLIMPFTISGLVIYWIYLSSHFSLFAADVIKRAYEIGWPYNKFTPNIFRTLYSASSEIYSYGSNGLGSEWNQKQLFVKSHFFMGWLLILVASVASFVKKMPVSMTALAGFMAVLLIFTGNFWSNSRYVVPVATVFILIAMWLDKQAEWVRTLYFVVSAIVLGAMLTLFSNGYWVG